MSVGRFEKVSEKQYLSDLANLGIADTDSYKDVVIPFRATKNSAGYDFVCPIDVCLKPNETIKIPSGIRCKIDETCVLQIYPRSSLGFKYQMCLLNTVGIIDSDYYNADNEGHIIVGIVNRGTKEFTIKKGERFVQGIFYKYETVEEDEVNNERHGGFGSTN